MKIFHPLLSLAAHYFIVYLVLFVPWDQEVVSASAAGQEQCPFRAVKLCSFCGSLSHYGGP